MRAAAQKEAKACYLEFSRLVTNPNALAYDDLHGFRRLVEFVVDSETKIAALTEVRRFGWIQKIGCVCC